MVLRSFKSDAVLSIFTDWNRPVPSLADVDPTALLWAPEASQACNGRSWKKRGHAREEREWRQERLSCNVKKPEGSNKLKPWRSLPYFGSLVRWKERRHRKSRSSHFFSHSQSCWALLLFLKQGGSRWKRYFCFRLFGWSANVTRLHWSSWQCRYMYLSNWLDDDAPCTPNGQYTEYSASMTSSSLLH